MSSFQPSRSPHTSPSAQQGAELLPLHPLPALMEAWPAVGNSSSAALVSSSVASHILLILGMPLCPKSSGYFKFIARKCASKMNEFLLRKYCHSLYNVVKGLTVANCSYVCMKSILSVIFQCKIVYVQKSYYWYKYCSFLLAHLYNHQVASVQIQSY